MVFSPGFVLLPLYIYPTPGAWDPLFSVAETYPSVTFTAVLNPDTGPGSGECPTSDYINATAYLNSIPNIQTLGYVHTAAAYDCGVYADYICPCTQTLEALETNITKYENWNTAGKCTTGDIHVDGIFFDEAPSLANCTTYMSNATAFAKSTLTSGNTVLFNPGEAVDSVYWSIADFINVFEDTELAYDSADIGALDGDGVYHSQATLIMYSYTDSGTILQRDVNTIFNLSNDSFAGLYITDQDGYTEFPSTSFFDAFAADVQAVVETNAAEG